MRVGPAHYLAEEKFVINNGDTLEITGPLIKIDGKDALVAREITKGSEKLVLRTANGISLWSGSRLR